MNINRKKELVTEYKNRKKETGALCIRHKTSGKSYIIASADIPADINSIKFRLSLGIYPSEGLQQTYRAEGEGAFEFLSVPFPQKEGAEEPTKRELEAFAEKVKAEYVAAAAANEK